MSKQNSIKTELNPAELLVPLVQHVESIGVKPKLFNFDFTYESSEGYQLLIRHFNFHTFEALEVAVKAAIANDYLEHPYLGEGRVLRLTTKGFHAGKSKEHSLNEQAERGPLKQLSDWINEHNGLTTAYAAIVGTLALVVGTIGIILRWPTN